MKIKTTITLQFLLLYVSTFLIGQSYSFEVRNSEYQELENSISLNEDMVWDDDEFLIPIDIDFLFFDKPLNQLYTDGTVFFSEIDEEKSQVLIPFLADLVDRGIVDIASSSLQSLSNISYKIEDINGVKILKIEINNAGFYSDIDDGISSDFVNYQLWLYEGSNNIEIHFGPSSIRDLDIAFDEAGLRVIFSEEFDSNVEVFAATMLLSGSSLSPNLHLFDSYIFQDEDNFFLDGIPPNGTIYSFSPLTTNTYNIVSSSIKVFPNPTSNTVGVDLFDNQILEHIYLINQNGIVVKKNTLSNSMNLIDMTSGIYTLEVQLKSGVKIYKRVVKI